MALGQVTQRHGHIGVAEADGMDLSIIAALMGVGEIHQQQQQAWDRFAITPTVPMVKKERPAPPTDGGQVPSPT